MKGRSFCSVNITSFKKRIQCSSTLSLRMSKISAIIALTKYKFLDSKEDILLCIKQLEEEENVYLRRGKCVTAESFNNDKRNRTKIGKFQKLHSVCSHFSIRNPRMHQSKRLNQNIMTNNCPVEIQFVFKQDVQKYQVTKVQLQHRDHPVSEEHVKTYARKK